MSLQSDIPNFQERQNMWKSIDFKRIEISLPAVEQFLKEIRPLYANGKVEHAAFTLPDSSIFDWYAIRNQYHEMGFFQEFWKACGPKKIFPYALHDLNFFDHKYFSLESSFHLGGSLAWMLSAGGAYHRFERGALKQCVSEKMRLTTFSLTVTMMH